MTASVLAVIPTHHRWDLLARAMDSLEDLPVLLVDDSPGGDLPRALACKSIEVVRTSGEEGFARATNCGLRRAQELGFEWVLLLNDDAALLPGALQALLDARSPEVGILAPVLVDEQGTESAGVDLASWGRVRLKHTISASVDQVAVSGACMLMRGRERMDSSYRHGMEDFDLCHRLRARGERIRVVPEARCHHQGGGSLSPRSRVGQRHGLSGQLRLFGGGWRSPLIVGLAIAQVVREGGPFDRFKGIWEGWQDWRSREDRLHSAEAASTRL